MKKYFLFALLIPFHSFGQVSRDMTAAEVAFSNRVSNTLLNSVPKDFKGWNVQWPSYDDAVVGTTRASGCAYGKECFWNFGFHIVYDGTTIQDDDYQALRDSLTHVAFDWHYVALMSRFTNSHQLTVDISVNETLYNGEFNYCGAKGYAKLPAIAPVDHYLFASISKCFPEDARGFVLDTNLLIFGNLPTITDRPEKGYNKSTVMFKLSTTLPTPFKVQNVVVRLIGSEKLVKEYMSKMDLTSLKKLLVQ